MIIRLEYRINAMLVRGMHRANRISMRSHWTQLLCTAPSIQMFAGYETTAAQTSWALILLLQHPDYLGHLCAEQDAVMHLALPSPRRGC